MSTKTYEEAAKKRVDAKVARNAERLTRRYTKDSTTARRSIENRQKFLRGRALGQA
ncbi:hypothetical protein [Mycetocola sp.]|uniref:hypothetical protein n=1 Tax=Mycetocola sp. TaxID=1871042 RepID=UPI003989AFD6